MHEKLVEEHRKRKEKIGELEATIKKQEEMLKTEESTSLKIKNL